MPAAPLSRTINPAYLHHLVDYLRSLNVDPADVYGVDFTHQLTQMDFNGRRPVEEWERMMVQAEAFLGDELLALKLAEFVKPWDAGAIGFITMASQNLREAMEALAEFYHLLNDAYTLRLAVDPRHFEIRMRPTGLPVPRLEMVTLAIMTWHARWLARSPDLVFDARFAFPAPLAHSQLQAYRNIFGGTLAFDQPESALWGPASYAGHVVSRGDHGVSATLRAQLVARMASFHDGSSHFVHKVERILMPRLENGQVTLEEVAHEAGVSIRTLQNRLGEAGVSYRQLLDRIRQAQAQAHIGDARLPLIEVAHRLGFATQSSFHHAFKRWTGLTPSEYRRRKSRPRSHEAQDQAHQS